MPMTAKLALMAAACVALWAAAMTDAGAAKRRVAAAPTKQCTYSARYTKCVEQGGGRNAGGRPAISCSRECENPCAH
jgi:hypothetical protein